MKPNQHSWRITIWLSARLLSFLTIAFRNARRVEPDRHKSVCFITETLGFGGTEVHTIGLIRSLIDRGHQIRLVCCSHYQYDERLAPEVRENKITIVYTDLKTNGVSWGATKKWGELLHQVQSEVLIFPKGRNSLGNLTFVLNCRKFFREIYWIEHLEADAPQALQIGISSSLTYLRNRLVQKLRSYTADRIIAVSEKVGNRLIQDCGYSPNKVIVIQNGVPWQEYIRDEQRGTVFRRHHSIPEDAFVFGMMTRLSEEKGVDLAIRALKHVLHAGAPKNIRLVIAGAGPGEECLRQLVNEFGLQDYVTFIGFAKNAADVLAGYDAILFPSRAEGLPLALLEGMAAGCIPIISRIGGMPEAVNSQDTGWVVPPENTDALSLAMRNVLALNTSQLLQIRRRVTGRIREAFDIRECHRQILEACGL